MRLTVPAYAKVNLSLEVLGKRLDGFHQVATVLQTISLHDTLSIQEGEEIQFQCNLPELASPENLVVKAAQLLQETTGCQKGAFIRLTKRIPVASGLGGGSSDGAAALLALNRLWGLGLFRQELALMGAKLGSDVPFFLYGGTALGEGRGELITPLPPLPKTWFLLARPPVALPNKTASVYGMLRPQDFTGGEATARLAEALKRGENLEPSLTSNVFDPVVFEKLPEVREHREAILGGRGPVPHLAGTGPTLFSLIRNEKEAKRLAQRLRRRGFEAYTAHSVGSNQTGYHLGLHIEKDYWGLVDEAWLRYWASKTLELEKAPSSTELGIAVTGDEVVRRLNAQYRGMDEPTDVLAFPLASEPAFAEPVPENLLASSFVLPPDGILHLGEVIISYPYAARQGRALGHPIPLEIAHLLVHGIFHLRGYNHEDPSDEEKMRAREKEILGCLPKSLFDHHGT